MDKNNIIIRLEQKKDHSTVENLVRESFWNVYRPGAVEHFVLKCLRQDIDFVQELDFVMEKDGKIIGQNVFVKTELKSDYGKNVPILTMGPICIDNQYKRMGYGKLLLDYSLEKAKELSKVILISMVKAGLNLPRNTGYAIMVYLKVKTRPSFFAKN